MRTKRVRRVRAERESGRPAAGWAEWIVGNGHWYAAPGPLLGLAILLVGLRRLGKRIVAWLDAGQR